MRKLFASLAIVGSLSAPAFAQTSYTFKHPSWMWEEGAVGLWHKARAAEFAAKYPGIKVDETEIPSANFEQVIDTQIAANDVPDLLPVFTNMLPSLIDAGALAPLDDCIATASYKDRLLSSISYAQKDGKTYGIPLTMSPQSLLYNKKLLDQAGVAVPTTVEEFYQAAKAIKEKTGQWGYGFNNNTKDVLDTYINSMQWVIGLGSDWSKPDGTITANDPKTVEAITWIKRFLDEGIAPRGQDVSTVRTMFAQGKVGFLFDGPWVMTQVKTDNPDLYPSIGYGTMPTPTHAAITGGAYYTIPAKSPHKADACKYLEIINAEPAQRDWLQNLVQIPGTSVAPSADFLKDNPWVGTMVEVATKYPGGLGYAPPGYGVNAAEFRQIVVDHLSQVYSGQKDVKTALDEAEKELQLGEEALIDAAAEPKAMPGGEIVMRKLFASLVIVGSLSVPTFAQTSYTFKHPSWMWEEGPTGVWYKARAAEFMAKYPNIKVDETQLSPSNFEQIIDTQIAAGDIPDLLPAYTNMLPPLIDAGVLAPLDDCIANSSYKDRLLPSISFAQKDGKTYGIPLTMSPQSMLYNQKLLDAAGVKVPTTVDEFYAAAKAVKDKTGQWGYAFTNNTSDVLDTYINSMQWVIGFGSDWSQPDGTITANAPKTIEAVGWIKRLLDESISPRGQDIATIRTMFAQGKVAFLFDGPWVLSQVKADNPALYPSVGFAVMPTPTHVAITGGAFYTIPAKSPHKADACNYLEIINAEPAQRGWLENLVQIPGTTVAPSADFLKANPWVSTMVEVAAKYPGGLGYASPGYGVNAAEFRQIVVDHLSQIYSGQKDVKTALDEAETELQGWAKKL